MPFSHELNMTAEVIIQLLFHGIHSLTHLFHKICGVFTLGQQLCHGLQGMSLKVTLEQTPQT